MLHQLPFYRLFQIVLSVFPSSSDASNHFHMETPSIFSIISYCLLRTWRWRFLKWSDDSKSTRSICSFHRNPLKIGRSWLCKVRNRFCDRNFYRQEDDCNFVSKGHLTILFRAAPYQLISFKNKGNTNKLPSLITRMCFESLCLQGTRAWVKRVEIRAREAGEIKGVWEAEGSDTPAPPLQFWAFCVMWGALLHDKSLFS